MFVLFKKSNCSITISIKKTYFPRSQYISFIMVGSGMSVVIFSEYQNSRPKSG